MTECLFCDIVTGKVPAEIVYDDDKIVAFRDTNPQAPVHLLLIPKRHLTSLNAIGDEDELLLGKILHVAVELAKDEGLSDSGYRLVSNCQREAGQSVFHLHFHLLGGRPMTWPPG